MSSNHVPIYAVLIVLSACSGAMADEHCSGTLCDFYYGTSSSFDDKPKPVAPPKPLMVPSGGLFGLWNKGQSDATTASGGAAPTSRPMIGVGGGGIASMARGEAQEKCSGTLCDLYYGKSSSFEEEKPTAPAAAIPSQEVTAEVAEPPAASPEMQGFHTRPEPPRCAANGHDPWICFR